MNRLNLIIKFLNKSMLNSAYKVAYNYYGQSELYKDITKTLLLIDDYNNGKINFDDIKRSIKVVTDDNNDILGYNKELAQFNDNFEKAIVNFAWICTGAFS